MHRTLRAALATLALLALPQFAAAGPIEWGYLASFDPDGGGRLGLGRTVVGPDGVLEIVASLRGEDLEAPGFGSQRIRIGSLLDIDVTTDDGFQMPSRQQFVSDLTITDFASGESGKVTVFGTGKYLGDDLLLDRRVMLELGAGSDRRELTLGGNRYDIAYSIVQGEDDRISTLVADVTVSPTAATPEPGTLALAGLGLCGLGLVRRLRRV
jgi:hypothetical protein